MTTIGTNCYFSFEQARAAVGVKPTDFNSDDAITLAANATCRLIDKAVGKPHGYWQDPSVVTRLYDAEDAWCCPIPDEISTTTGLIVKTDTGDDGTFATTLTLNTDFVLLPRNAILDGESYNEIRVLTTSSNYFPPVTPGRPGVQVTAKFGYATVPDRVTKAGLVHMTRLYKSTPFGIVELGDTGLAARLSASLHPDAMALLASDVKVYV